MLLALASCVFWLVSSLMNLWGIRAAYVANVGAQGAGFVALCGLVSLAVDPESQAIDGRRLMQAVDVKRLM
jgi:hypothetical protein